MELSLQGFRADTQVGCVFNRYAGLENVWCVYLSSFSLFFFSPSRSLSCQKQFQDLAEMLRNFLTRSSMKPRSWRVVCLCLFRHYACLSACPSVHLSMYVTSCVHRLRLFCLCMVHCLRSLLTRAPSRHFERRFSLSRIMCLGHHSLYLVMTYLAPLG